MTRPLALIEGDLTIPLPRPFDGLPPPFGVRRRLLREAVHQAIEEPAQPAWRPGMVPPGVKHILSYKIPQRKVDTYKIDVALAEAKRYLEMSTVRPRSSRSDHVLAASIFAGCTIALTWLLVTCSIKDAESTKADLVKHPVLVADSSRSGQPGATPQTATGNTRTEIAVKTISNPVANASSVAPTVLAGTKNAPVATRRVHVTSLGEAHVKERVKLSQATRPAVRPTVSVQPEWRAGVSRPDVEASVDDAPWLNWAAQRHSLPATTRATTPIDNSWNGHMIQRRITDDPAAFHVDRRGQ